MWLRPILLIRPCWAKPRFPSSQITTSAKVRRMSIPIRRLTISLLIEEKRAWGLTAARQRAEKKFTASWTLLNSSPILGVSDSIPVDESEMFP